MKAVVSGKAEKVILALDADTHIREEILSLCKTHGVKTEAYKSKKALGILGGINRHAAAIAILKETKTSD